MPPLARAVVLVAVAAVLAAACAESPPPAASSPLAPDPVAPAPTPDGAAPTPDGAAPKPDGTAPKPDGTAPKPDGAAPKPDGAAPKPDGAAPTPDGTAPKPDGTAPDRVAPAPVAVASGPCEIRLRVEAQAEGAAAQVVVVAENVTSAPVDFDLPDRCPSGEVELDGLGPGFDYYGTCNRGACPPGARGPRHVHLEPHQKETLASAAFSLDGATCTKPVAPGAHTIRAVVAPLGSRFCTMPARIDVVAKADRPAPECTTSDECTLACPTAPGCCGWACGCKNAMTKKKAREFIASFPKTCQRAPCPAMGCAYSAAFGAVCSQGRCVAGSSAGGPMH